MIGSRVEIGDVVYRVNCSNADDRSSGGSC